MGCFAGGRVSRELFRELFRESGGKARAHLGGSLIGRGPRLISRA